MKPASLEESQEQELRLRESESHAEKGYIDLSQETAPPPEEEAQFRPDALGGVRVRRVRNGMGRKNTEARRMMAGLKFEVRQAGPSIPPGAKEKGKKEIGARCGRTR